MSLQAMKWAMSKAPIKRDAAQCRNRLVLIALADRYNDDTGVCWPSIKTISEEIGVSVPTVHKAIRSLEKAGLIARGNPHWVSHLRPDRRPTVWTLSLDMVKPEEGGRETDNGVAEVLDRGEGVFTPQDERGKDVLTERGKGVFNARGKDVLTDGVKTSLHKPKGNPNPEPKPEPKDLDHPADDRFTEFWGTVPRKVGKGAARRAWKKAVKKVDPQVIIEGMRRYRDDPNRADEFTAHPSSWLNAERWDDDPLPARGGGQKAPSFLDFAPSRSTACNPHVDAPYSGELPSSTHSPLPPGIEPPTGPQALFEEYPE